MTLLPKGWIEIHCNECGNKIGAYDTTKPQPILEFYCRKCDNATFIEPAIRR